MKNWIAALFTLSLSTSLLARESADQYLFDEEPKGPRPWFTGPLLTPSGHVVPKGHQNYEPYIYWRRAKGTYDKHWKSHSHPTNTRVLYQALVQLGVMADTEFDFAPQFLYSNYQGQHTWRVSDMPLVLAFQLLYDQIDSWYPGIKIRVGANVPLGKYDRLDPARLGTDAGGVGTWYPGMGVVLTRLHHFTGVHYLAWRLFFNYSVGTPLNVKGLNDYGGAPSIAGIKGTSGTVYPGNIFLFLGGFEFSLTQNWVLALDIQYQHNDRTRFSGYSPPGTKPGIPSREHFSLAPAIEYNWSTNVGIIAGPWISIAGRNAQNFITYVSAINLYY